MKMMTLEEKKYAGQVVAFLPLAFSSKASCAFPVSHRKTAAIGIIAAEEKNLVRLQLRRDGRKDGSRSENTSVLYWKLLKDRAVILSYRVSKAF